MSATTGHKPHFAWRDAIIGAVISLVVAVISGVVLWVLTRQPDKSEKLIYRVESPSVFPASGRNVGLQIITVRNDGSSKSEDVIIDIVLPPGTRLLDKNIAFDSGKSVSFRERAIERGVSFTIPSLLPKDKASISLLTVGSSGRTVVATVRSEQQIASRERLERVDAGSGIKLYTAVILLLIAQVSQYVVLQYLSYRAFKQRRRKFFEAAESTAAYSPSQNNVGFIFMHSGLLDEAEEVLWEAVKGGNAELMTFSHYAAVLALKGDAKADEYIRAAEWPTLDTHERANLEVDKFIVNASRGDADAAEVSLRKAFEKSKSVRPYFENSDLLKKLLAKTGLTQAFYDIINK